jgi:DNA-directed RNA polymerase specialized sigma24 family protein
MSYDSTELISQLKNGSSDAYIALYQKSYPSVEKFIVNNSGTVDDAKDIFQDTLLVLFKKVREDNFELTASVKTYIIAISKNLWCKKLRHISGRQETSLTDFHSTNFFAKSNQPY